MFKCPYCEEDLRRPDEAFEEDETYEHECPYCDKRFVYGVSWHIYYDTRKADCLNGDAHHLEPIHGSPAEYFANKQRCSECGQEFVKQPAPAKGEG